MYSQKKCVAMLLAGGQGSRLYALTTKVAKPAVSFGAKYRIIDFTLSNCVNSNIDTVGVLTQYQPLVLNEYIGNGQPWDLDRTFGGVHILPPYQAKYGSEWYKGTANAIYQNLGFIENYDPDHVLILSGDHIYKMDYNLMLNEHIKTNADCTIAVLEVPLTEASRFGIMNTDNHNQITDFEEKPKYPKSNLASMGIYIFKKDKLFKYLKEDAQNPNSQNDFGKNIIPTMLASGEKMIAYPFKGYWKDVGTISSLWEANMDLLEEDNEFNLDDATWPIMARSSALPPHYIAKTGEVKQSLVTEGCQIEGKVEHSILFSGVKIGKNSQVIDSIIMNNTVIGENVYIKKAIIGNDCIIENDVSINEDGIETPEYVSTRICSQDLSLIAPKVKIYKNVKIGKLSMINASIKAKEGQR